MQCPMFPRSRHIKYRDDGAQGLLFSSSQFLDANPALSEASVSRMDSLASGEQIQAFAYQLAPLSPKGLGLAIDVVGIALGIIGIIALSLRLYVRLGFSAGPNRSLGPDDFLTVFGTLTFAAAIVFAIYATRYGLGSPVSELPSPLYQIRAAEYVLYWEQHGIPYYTPWDPKRDTMNLQN
ncbi:hypothetical protein DHEL01_v204982 [Diaporthe helianthi]|uniref:Uncharacterized protein n=1 Tax=Diaporthe helianthi TaxID=158607 RepID=A0A2P5I2D7_DIAHE|nr:hypothetical protein DHEL01_v204982 [Diaporthe helianthi]